MSPYRDNPHATDVDEAYQLGYARGYGDRVDGAPRLVEWILFSIGWACFVGLGAEVLGRLWGAW